MASKFDFKQFFFDKGERVGLIAAAGIGGLLLVTALFWPGYGLLADTPANNVKKLKEPTERADNLLKRGGVTPNDDELPPKSGVSTDAFTNTRISPEEQQLYQVAGLFSPAGKPDPRRSQPTVLTVEESRPAVARLQVRSWVLSPDYKQIGVIEGGTGAGSSLNDLKNMYGMPGMPGGGKGGAGGPLSGPGGGAGESDGQKGKKITFVNIEKLGEAKGVPAEEVVPLRVAIISGDFPFRAQVEEYMRRLRLDSPQSVIDEINVFDKDATDAEAAQGQNSFRFMGLILERRELDKLGQPIVNENTNKDGWMHIDLEGKFVDIVLRSGQQTEPEDDPNLDRLCFPGLVMPRLRQMRDKQYPPLEKDLPKIKQTLGELESAGKKDVVQPKNPWDRKNFNPWRNRQPEQFPTNADNRPAGSPMMSKAPTPLSGASKGPRSAAPDGLPGATDPNRDFIPEYCLVRAINVSIEPGKVYEYRMKVKMANPNYKLPTEKIASKTYADEPFLVSQEWHVVPTKVSVPAEVLYYAVDQKELDGGKYQGLNAAPNYDPRRVAVLQVHRWMQNLNESAKLPIGEWIVAERLPVRRGEYVAGTPIRGLAVPYWNSNLEEFTFATDSNPAPRPPQYKEVRNLGYAHNDTILIDFEGGDLSYERVGLKGEKAVIKEKAPSEVLLFSHDGKLLSLDGETDKNDPERLKVLTSYRDRVKEIKDKKKPSAGVGPGGISPGG